MELKVPRGGGGLSGMSPNPLHGVERSFEKPRSSDGNMFLRIHYMELKGASRASFPYTGLLGIHYMELKEPEDRGTLFWLPSESITWS